MYQRKSKTDHVVDFNTGIAAYLSRRRHCTTDHFDKYGVQKDSQCKFLMITNSGTGDVVLRKGGHGAAHTTTFFCVAVDVDAW